MAPCDSGATHIAFGEHDGLGLHNVVISWLNPTPHAITVYASDPALPRRPQHSLPGGSLCLTRTGLAPVGSRQLRLAHRVRTPRQDRAAAAVCLSFRPAMAWGDRTSRRCRALTAAC